MKKKIDFKKELKHLYKASAKEAVLVDVPPMQYLMVEGKGDPGTSIDFKNAIEALYPLAYTIKFMSKIDNEQDYVVMPLECQWWMDNIEIDGFDENRRDDWKFNVMIMQPDFITHEMFEVALEKVKTKKNPTALHLVKFETIEEGKVVQIMHLGPYSEEGPTVQKMHNFAYSKGYKLRGRHREVYLSDIRRTQPEKLKTILRQPII
jgi:hypothetical protein